MMSEYGWFYIKGLRSSLRPRRLTSVRWRTISYKKRRNKNSINQFNTNKTLKKVRL